MGALKAAFFSGQLVVSLRVRWHLSARDSCWQLEDEAFPSKSLPALLLGGGCLSQGLRITLQAARSWGQEGVKRLSLAFELRIGHEVGRQALQGQK